MPPKKNPPGADWFSWTLHLLLGLVVGLVVGFVIAFRMVRYHFLNIEALHEALGGMTLLGGAMTSFLGNRAWFRRSLFDPEEPPQSWVSRGASIVIGLSGCAFIGQALFVETNQSNYWHSAHQTEPVAKPFLGLAVALLSFVIYYALRHGSALTGLQIVEREEQPHLFWLFVISALLADLYVLARLWA